MLSDESINEAYRLAWKGVDGPELIWLPLSLLRSEAILKLGELRQDIQDFLKATEAGEGERMVLVSGDAIGFDDGVDLVLYQSQVGPLSAKDAAS